MKRTFYITVSFFIMSLSCKEVYNPSVVSPQTGYLVVEGFINSGGGSSTITLSRTTKLEDSAVVIFEQHAQVNIEDENNAVYPLLEKDSGNYVSPDLNLNPNLKYRVHIKTADGKEYVSDYTQSKQTPPIDSITWKVDNGGVRIYVNAHDAATNTRYFQWKYTETWEFHSAFAPILAYTRDPITNQITGIVQLGSPDFSLYKCWKTQSSRNILLGTTDKLTENGIYVPIRYIEPESYELSVLYYIEVKQYALSRDAYLFKEKLKKNTEQLGTIFDPQPSELGGNLHCLSNPAEQVIGFVDISEEKEAKLYIDNSELLDWPGVQQCGTVKLKNEPGNYTADLLPIRGAESGPFGSILSYYAAVPECVDCTLRGTNKKPSFWPR